MTTASERPAASDGLTSTTFQVRSWFQPNICLRNALKVASPGSGPCESVDAPAVVLAGGFNVVAGGCCALAQRLAKAKAVVINTTVQRFMVPFLSKTQCLNQMCKSNVQGMATSPPWRRWDSGAQSRMLSPKSSGRERLAGACIRSCPPYEPPCAPVLERSCAALQSPPETGCLPRSLPELYRELHKAAANRCPSGQAAIPRTEAFLWWTPESPATANSRSVPGGKPAFWARRR